MAVKEWGSLAVSVMALLVSSTVAYYSLFRVRHSTSVVLGNDYGVFTTFEERGLASFATDRGLVFINNGTHPVAVIGMQVNLYQTRNLDERRQDCRLQEREILDRAAARASSGFEPFVVPGKDVRIIRPTFTYNPSAQRVAVVRVGEIPGHIFTARGQDRVPNFISCLQISFVPAGGQVETVERPIFRTVDEGTSPGPFGDGSVITLVRRTEGPF